jgi:hypothetical protein
VREGIPEAAFTDTHEESTRLLGLQQLLCVLAGNDTVEPIVETSALVDTSSLLHFNLLVPAHGAVRGAKQAVKAWFEKGGKEKRREGKGENKTRYLATCALIR